MFFEALDVVQAEQTGFVSAVGRDSSAARASVGEDVTFPIVDALAAEDLTPANVSATPPARTIRPGTLKITKSRSVPFGLTGEEARTLINGGNLGTVTRDTIAQALRTLRNEMDGDIADLHIHASRAHGTATGTPFATASDFTDFAQPWKILEDNGAPMSDWRMVLASSHITNIRAKQSGLFEVNRAGNADLLRRGVIGDVENFGIGTSAAVRTSVAGTAASATTNAAGYAVGATVITLASAGTGTLVAGDIITFSGDSNQYVIESGDTDVSNGGTITLAEPGLRVAMSAATKNITVIAATKRSMFFYRRAIQLVTRAPAMPPEGDMADDIMTVTDPYTGIVYELALYKQKRQVRYELNLAWGVKMVMPRYCGLLIGA
jgi:hypothetical protein